MVLRIWLVCLIGTLSVGTSCRAADLLPISTVEKQPFAAAADRLMTALQLAGAPLSADQTLQLQAAIAELDPDKSVLAIQRVLDPLCLVEIHINPESRVKVIEGPATKELVEQGWRTFLLKVRNEAGINPVLRVASPNSLPMYHRGSGPRQRPLTDKKSVTPEEVLPRFLDVAPFERQPMKRALSGLEVEYRIIQLYSRDAGKRDATLLFDIGQGTQDLDFRSELSLLFDCQPAVSVRLGVKDFNGEPTSAAFVIRDALNRVYPNPARRLAPDFFFHNQVYRADGETVLLPPGKYTIEVSRGPEYLVQRKTLQVADDDDQHFDVQLERWTHPASRGWYSGDHHIHAAGCAHYDSPTEGVGPQDMMRHILGEDLNVGCVLTWGPCWYSQKQNFEGKTSDLSRDNYLMRYDVEVSGFPSSHAGHLCLLRLTEDDYPGTSRIEDWPSWTLPVMQWAKRQGGVVGYAHSGYGLAVADYDDDSKYHKARPRGKREADILPDYTMPRFDGIGANEYIVTVAHGMCDFIATVNTPPVWELNIWYHTLNCGMRCRISGETDFPCIYGDKVGLGRVYAKLLPDQELTFDNWVDGVRDGRSYCGDGFSHIFDFQVNDVAIGEPGTHGTISEVALAEPGNVQVSFDVQAFLDETPSKEAQRIRSRQLDEKPYWHIERCRVGKSRRVPVELIVNGVPIARQEIEADGSLQSLAFSIPLEYSSWVAVRILPSVHTNPIFVTIDDQPIRCSRRSARWCRDAVEVCWNSKQARIREEERPAARAAYTAARRIYEDVFAQAVAD